MEASYNLLLYSLIVIAAVLAVVMVYLILLVRTVSKELSRTPETDLIEAEYQNQPLLNRLLSLHPLSHEKKLVMEHSFDGIAELDNPTPPWFNFLFYGTIAFGFVYMFFFHLVGDGNIQESEYKAEVAQAEIVRAEYMKKFANSINEDNVTALTEPKALAEGKVVYDKYCVACHGTLGEGKVGPNLTDVYWLHGNTVKNIFHTITEGVPQKGMISWKKQLNPLQIQQVTSYIMTLQGTNPPNPKEPQGEAIN